jgi:2-amino-4-hydroxy-6-hydroxymethyldihydropteridine diphosphokinase
MEKVFLGLGGNIGDVLSTLKKAESFLKLNPSIKNVLFSRYYTTSPVSDIAQNNYINCVCSLETDFTPIELLAVTQNIEIQLGKVKKDKNMPRKVDIDILLFGQKMVQSRQLDIPHPYWKDRLFVLTPLSDLVDEVITPDNKRVRIKELIDELKGRSDQRQHYVELFKE